jgi:hypothetical protein
MEMSCQLGALVALLPRKERPLPAQWFQGACQQFKVYAKCLPHLLLRTSPIKRYPSEGDSSTEPSK